MIVLKRRRKLVFFSLSLVACILCPQVSECVAKQVDSDEIVQKVLENFQAREDETSSCEVDWVESTVISARRHKSLGVSDSAKAIRFDYRFVLDGDATRMDDYGPVFDHHVNKFINRSSVEVTAGKLHWHYTAPDEINEKNYPMANLRHDKTTWSNNYYALQPMRILLRPISSTNIKPTLFERPVTVDGHECVVLRYRKDLHITKDVWVDEKDLSTVRRFVMNYDDRQMAKIDFNYRGAVDDLLDLTWKIIIFDKLGEPVETTNVEVKQVLQNCEVDKSIFEFSVPSGVRVMDYRNGQFEQYISVAEGKRVIQVDESVAPYSKLLNSESGQALAKPSFSYYWFLLIGGGIFAVLFGVGTRRRKDERKNLGGQS